MPRTTTVRRFIIALAAIGAVVVPAATAQTASAAPHETARRSNGATIVFEPAGPIPTGARYGVVASGFRPNTWVTIGASYDTVYWYSGVTDSSGRLRLTLDARAAGTIRHEAWEQGAHQMRLKATAYIVVTTN